MYFVCYKTHHHHQKVTVFYSFYLFFFIFLRIFFFIFLIQHWKSFLTFSFCFNFLSCLEIFFPLSLSNFAQLTSSDNIGEAFFFFSILFSISLFLSHFCFLKMSHFYSKLTHFFVVVVVVVILPVTRSLYLFSQFIFMEMKEQH